MAFQALSSLQPSRIQPPRNARKTQCDDFFYPSSQPSTNFSSQPPTIPSSQSSIICGSTQSDSQFLANVGNQHIVPDTQSILTGNDSLSFGSQTQNLVTESQTVVSETDNFMCDTATSTPASRLGFSMFSANTLSNTLSNSIDEKQFSHSLLPKTNLTRHQDESVPRSSTPRAILPVKIFHSAASQTLPDLVSKKDVQTSTSCLTTLQDASAQTELEQVQSVDPGKSGVLLFRAGCRLHILSNFAYSPLSHNGQDYPTAEHAYQHIKALHHQEYSKAVTIRRSKTAAKAKRVSNSIKQNESWSSVKVDVMRNILISKCKQSAKFREALLSTGTSHLIHNVENDSFWGCGEDMNGLNVLGTLLEDLRKSQYVLSSGEQSPSQKKPMQNQVLSSGEQSLSQKKPMQNQVHLHHQLTDAISHDTDLDLTKKRKTKLVVLSDSILRNTIDFIDSTKYDTYIECYGGITPLKIADKVGALLSDKQPDAIVVHCGTNAVTDNIQSAKLGFEKLIGIIKWSAPNTKIIISGIIHRLDRKYLNSRIDMLNDFLVNMEDDQTVFVEHNATFRSLRNIIGNDGLHLKPAGKKQVAKNLMLVLEIGNCIHTHQRTRWVPQHVSHESTHLQPRRQKQSNRRSPSRRWQAPSMRLHNDPIDPISLEHLQNSTTQRNEHLVQLCSEPTGPISPQHVYIPNTQTNEHLVQFRSEPFGLVSPQHLQTANMPMNEHLVPSSPPPFFYPPWLQFPPSHSAARPWGHY